MEVLHTLALVSMALGALVCWVCAAACVWWLLRDWSRPARARVGAWVRPAVRVPPSEDFVLAVVSGQAPRGGPRFDRALQLAVYSPDCGWVVDGYEDWEDPEVTWWAPLPVAPEEGGDKYGTR